MKKSILFLFAMFLMISANAQTSATQAVKLLPTPTGHAGQFLQTNGLTSNWAPIPAGLTGSGTFNYIPKFDTSGTKLKNSQLFDDGYGVSVGVNSPLARFYVSGAGLSTYDNVFKVNDKDGNNIISTQSTNTIDFGYLQYGVDKITFNSGAILVNGFTNNISTFFGIKGKAYSSSFAIKDVDDITVKYIIDANYNVGVGLQNPTAKIEILTDDNSSSYFGFKCNNPAGKQLFHIRNDGVILAPSIPTGSVGLPSGAIYSNAGVLMITP
jgi:hypothetical protein